MTTETAEQPLFDVWTDIGKVVGSDFLQKGDLVEVIFKGDKKQPIPGVFKGTENDITLGDVVMIELPLSFEYHRSAGTRVLSSKNEKYALINVAHIQFLARGLSAAILFHICGRYFCKHKDLLERMGQINELSKS